ncbi:ABC transporter substrate-binding protein [Candidatus Williamhamiltonella defendens]|nr:ABC transporter substrate-binding protein [Candidatus Hamiltonella defensa]
MFLNFIRSKHPVFYKKTGCFFLILFLLIMASASWAEERFLHQDETGKLTTLTDLLGRKVKVRVPVKRMMLGEGRQLYLVAMLNKENPLQHIVAWRKDLMESDPATYRLYLKKYPHLANIPIFGGFEEGTFNIEQAVVLRPDVIIMNIESQRATEEAKYHEKLSALGIPIVYVDFRYHPIENTETTVQLFGKLLGQEKRAREFIHFRREQMKRVTEVLAAERPHPPKVFIERVGGYTDECCLSFGKDNFGRFVTLAGGENIAHELSVGTFIQLHPEQVMVANPDKIVITSGNWQAFVPNGDWIGLGPNEDLKIAEKKLEFFIHRPAYFGTKAVKNREFYAIWHQFYNSPYDFIAIQQLAKWFHPNLFQSLDPNATFREFHERFLPVPYEPGYFIALNY